ncbi:MAG: hypothetical protein JWN34_4138 [Bryobacterales bacterium]|nr:hypothetical protein [Bryobacterales bacterium]
MDDFADVARAKASYKLYADAMNKGREILTRAGIAAAPPPVPEFDAIFRRLKPDARQELYAGLREIEEITPIDAMRVWKAAITRSFKEAKR